MSITAQEWSIIRKEITERLPSLQQHSALTGFDGFVDNIHRIISNKSIQQSASYFESTRQLADYLQEKVGSSFSLETDLRESRMGGNMPLISMGLARMGIKVNGFGAFGWPLPHPAFDALRDLAQLHSFANPGLSQAYEFSDGKMMLADMGELNNTGWEILKERIGLSTILQLYAKADLLCFMNWSEVDASNDIWHGMYRDCIQPTGKFTTKICFTDLSDFSKRHKTSVVQLFQLLREIGNHCQWVLGMNRNEALLASRYLDIGERGDSIAAIAKEIYRHVQPSCLVIHEASTAIAIRGNEMEELKSFYTSSPRTLTGAGDHFSAGFCAGLLMHLPLKVCLLMGNALAGYLVQYGRTADAATLIAYLDSQLPSD